MRELGRGVSKGLTEKLGIGGVYLHHLKRLHELVTKRGFRMAMWADVLKHHPDLMPELPDDILLIDVTFVGGDMVTLFRDFHIPGIHSAPLSEAHPFASPALGPLRKRLCAMCGRPVNLQATTSLVQFLRDVVMDQPYLVLLKKPSEDDTEPSATMRDD